MKKNTFDLKKSLLNMKKHTLLIIIGGVFLLTGMILYNGREQTVYYYVDSKLTKDEARALILDRTKTIVDLYEKVDESFSVEKANSQEETEDNKYLKALNYDQVVDSIYTENGKEELESIKFDKTSFVEKKDDGVYILSSIPDNNSYVDCAVSIDDIIVKEDTITASVSFTSDSIDKENITYYIYKKDIKLVKEDDNWLIDTFIYSN